MDNLPITTDSSSKPGFFSNPKNVAITTVGLGFAAVASYFFFIYVLPVLVTIAWNAVSLCIAGGILFFLLLIFSNKKFWRALRYLAEFVSNYTFGLVIEMNPFAIIESQIEQGEKDREGLIKQKNKVSAKKEDLVKQIQDKNTFLTDNKYKAEAIMKQAEAKNEDRSEEISLYSNNVKRAQEFIDQVQPIANDLSAIEEFCDKTYKVTGYKLVDARNELNIKKSAFEAVTSGLSVAQSAWKALNGDDLDRQAADKAMEAIRHKVSNSLAEMKNTMRMSGDVIKDLDLSNAVKARKGIELIKQMNLAGATSYVGSQFNNVSSGNLKEIQQNLNKNNKYNDLLGDN